MKKFWTVWRNGDDESKVMHDSKVKAIAEAKLLAGVNPGSIFFVMEATVFIQSIISAPTIFKFDKK